MKKLESIKGEKFVVSEDQLLQIKGGYGPTSDYSVEYSSTSFGSGNTASDAKVTDICGDWS